MCYIKKSRMMGLGSPSSAPGDDYSRAVRRQLHEARETQKRVSFVITKPSQYKWDLWTVYDP